LSCVINTSAIPPGCSSDLAARRNALSNGSESASDAATDGDLQGAGQDGLTGVSPLTTPSVGDLAATPRPECHTDMTLDDQRTYFEDSSCADFATKNMGVGGEDIAKMVDATTDICRSRSPVVKTEGLDAKMETSAELTCVPEERQKPAARVPLSFGVDSIMAGTVRRCSRPTGDKVAVKNSVNSSPMTRFSVDNILSSVCVNSATPQSQSPRRCHLTGTTTVALMADVSPAKLSSEVPAAWATTSPDFLARQGKN